jgi:hypothetical protein
MVSDYLFPAVVILLKFVYKLAIGRSVSGVDFFRALLNFPIDLAFLALSFAAAICLRLDLACLRGDEQRALGDVLSHVVRQLAKARVVIADVGNRNPNVFYELGLAHAFDKQTILIAKSIEGVPFNLRNSRVLIYSSEDSLERELTTMLARGGHEEMITLSLSANSTCGVQPKRMQFCSISRSTAKCQPT